MPFSNPLRSILLFGPPGVGKGTQGKILGTIPGFIHLSMGDVFRSLNCHSPIGLEVNQYTSQGHFVPDDVTIRVWENALSTEVVAGRYKPSTDILVSDGMPRNVAQAELIKDYLDIQAIIHLDCGDPEDMVERLRKRATCESRIDDADESVIRRRFDIYREMSEPVLACYPPEIIARVDPLGSPAAVLCRILKHLNHC